MIEKLIYGQQRQGFTSTRLMVLLAITITILLVCCNDVIECRQEVPTLQSLPSKLITNQWDVHLHQPGTVKMAKRVAHDTGFTLVRENKLKPSSGQFVFQHHAVPHASLMKSWAHHRALERHPYVQRAVQAEGFMRRKRGYKNVVPLPEIHRLKKGIPTTHHGKEQSKERSVPQKVPTDPLFSKEWYIRNTGQAEGVRYLDLNVLDAWAQGITGLGVTTAIMDDGIDYLHPDLAANYNAESSFDFSSNDPYPFPRYTDDWFNSHGTRCAGEISAVRDNGICGVGVAYNSKVAGLRMLDQPYMTDLIEAAAMSHDRDNIDIYSASWGPTDDGMTVDGPRNETMRAIVEGVNKGRHGRGNIYVWASGDGGAADDCNCDGYAASMWTISINSATNDGETASYDESCSSTLASTFSNGKAWFSEDAGVGTVDLYGRCTLHHSGTSAAAPEAAAVFALALEANRKLGWRDVQHLAVLTSKRNHLHDRDRRHNWTINGAGLEFNHLFGYGVLDAGDMVRVARDWVNVPERFHCVAGTIRGRYRFNVTKAVVLEINTDACTSDSGHSVRYLEHVQSFVTVVGSRRGDITIFLTSPMNTTSMLLSRRVKDADRHRGFTKWPFMTTHTWGENPRGLWRLTVLFDTDDPLSQGLLSEWVLVLHGTQKAPYSALSTSLEKVIPKLGVIKRQHASARFQQ